MTITLNDGTVLNEVEILYPVGHKRCVFAHLLVFIRVSAKISCFVAAERKVPHY